MSVFPAYTTVPASAESYQRAAVQGSVLLALTALILAQLFRAPILVHERPTLTQTIEAPAPRPRVVVSQLEVEPALFGKETMVVRFGAASFTATRTAINAQQGAYEVQLDEGRILKVYVRPITRGKRSSTRRT